MALNPRERLTKARISLQKQNPFFSYLVLQLYFHEDKGEKSGGSIGIDIMGNVYYNPDFIEKLTDNEVIGVLCHEVLHLVLEHLRRRNDREGLVWNIACDIAVNNMLVHNDFALAKGGLIPFGNEINAFGIHITEIDQKVAERIFDELAKKIKKVEYHFDTHIISEEGKGKGQNGKGEKKSFSARLDGRDGEGNKQENGKNADDFSENTEPPNWKRILAEAYQFAKSRGTKPAGMDRYIKEIMFPRQNWLHLIYRYVISEIPFDYSYVRPSKRSYATGIYMPQIKKELLDIVVSVDTSLSIGDKELKEFLSQIIGIVRNFNSVRLTVLACDSEIHAVYELNRATEKDIMAINLKGGGGTSFKPPIEWLKKNKPHAKLLIYFTDGRGDSVDLKGVGFNIIWLITKEGTDELVADKGTVVQIE
jgi:predicted metal-dependent peptidase